MRKDRRKNDPHNSLWVSGMRNSESDNRAYGFRVENASPFRCQKESCVLPEC